MPRGSAPGERRGGRAKAAASQHGQDAIHELARLAGLVEDGKGKAESVEDQIAALNGILDLGYGKPTKPLLQTRVELAPNASVGAANERDHRTPAGSL